MKKLNIQKGFTLIEMVIAIGILAMMAAIAVFSYNGDKSRAGLLVGLLDGYANAEKMLKSNTSCYSKSLSGLNNPTDANPSWCGADLTKQWAGPYATPFDVDASLFVKASALSPDMILTTVRVPSTFGGSSSTIPSYKWYIAAINVPDGILTEAMTTCNGAADANAGTTGSASNRKCLDATAGVTGAEYGIGGSSAPAVAGGQKIMFYLFDETRK